MKLKFIILSIIVAVGIFISGFGFYTLHEVNNDIKLGVENFKSQKNSPDHSEYKNVTETQDASQNNNNSFNQTTSKDPIAVLEFINNNSYKCAVYNHVCKQSLQFGAGRLLSSAFPCENGNCVLYGHRDSAFKTIQNVKENDIIKVTTKYESANYSVYQTFITEPTDPKIFESTQNKELTLVTCYPFYFVGPAPKRYIVRARVL